MQLSLFVVYVTHHLGRSEAEYGVFMTAVALGSLVGSVIGPFVARIFDEKRLIMAGLVLHYAAFSALGLIADYQVALAVAFCVFYVTIVGIHSLRDRSTRADVRGRVYGASTSIFTPPTIVSILVGGYLADVVGVSVVFVGAGALAVASAIWIVWSLEVPAREPALAAAGDEDPA
jgi:predicted MFS family arabinose efflux permease